MDNTIEVWADGSCSPNPGIGGWGWHDSLGNQGTGGAKQSTNNRMEMTAILEALKTYPNGTNVVVYSDSVYCVKGLTEWRAKWKRNNWSKKGAPMPNKDLWVALEEQLNRLKVRVEWVKGHNGNEGNEKADALAEKGRADAAVQQKEVRSIPVAIDGSKIANSFVSHAKIGDVAIKPLTLGEAYSEIEALKSRVALLEQAIIKLM